MDRVLLDCGILSFVIALVLGCGSYMCGGEILKVYTEDPEVAVWRFFPSPQCLISYVESWIFFLALSGEWDIPVCL